MKVRNVAETCDTVAVRVLTAAVVLGIIRDNWKKMQNTISGGIGMISFRIEEIKVFTKKLFLGEDFDEFLSNRL